MPSGSQHREVASQIYPNILEELQFSLKASYTYRVLGAQPAGKRSFIEKYFGGTQHHNQLWQALRATDFSLASPPPSPVYKNIIIMDNTRPGGRHRGGYEFNSTPRNVTKDQSSEISITHFFLVACFFSLSLSL